MAKKLDIKSLKTGTTLIPIDRNDKHYVHCHILIVCEGKETEQNYFKSFEMMKTSQDYVFEVQSDGGGINTIQVVDEAIKLRDEAKEKGTEFDSVWAVFDKDSFDEQKFDNAINKAEKNNIGCAWSNEAFELWYVYHFDDRCTAMPRGEYKKKITNQVRTKTGDATYTYKKNDKEMRKRLSECGDENLAIRFAEKQDASWTDRRYHTHNPNTTVYKLVRLLRGEDAEFNALIKKKLTQ